MASIDIIFLLSCLSLRLVVVKTLFAAPSNEQSRMVTRTRPESERIGRELVNQRVRTRRTYDYTTTNRDEGMFRVINWLRS